MARCDSLGRLVDRSILRISISDSEASVTNRLSELNEEVRPFSPKEQDFGSGVLRTVHILHWLIHRALRRSLQAREQRLHGRHDTYPRSCTGLEARYSTPCKHRVDASSRTTKDTSTENFHSVVR